MSGFSAVSLSGHGRVTIEQTGTESLTVTTLACFDVTAVDKAIEILKQKF